MNRTYGNANSMFEAAQDLRDNAWIGCLAEQHRERRKNRKCCSSKHRLEMLDSLRRMVNSDARRMRARMSANCRLRVFDHRLSLRHKRHLSLQWIRNFVGSGRTSSISLQSNETKEQE